MSEKEIRSFLVDKTYAESTEESYGYMLERAFKYLDTFDNLSPVGFRDWLDSNEDWSSATRWLGYSAVRAFIKWKYGRNHPALDLSIRREESGPQRTLSISQAKRLDHYLSERKDNKGIRDLAIFSLMIDTGLRSSEIVRLNRDSLDTSNRLLNVKVKGGQYGYAIYSPITLIRLLNWLDKRVDHVENSKALFISIKGTRPGTRLTSSGLRVIVRRWGERSGIGNLSPHDFRRSFATISTLLKAPARMVQMAGRWSRLKEVERYTRGLQLKDFDDYLPMREIHKSEN